MNLRFFLCSLLACTLFSTTSWACKDLLYPEHLPFGTTSSYSDIYVAQIVNNGSTTDSNKSPITIKIKIENTLKGKYKANDIVDTYILTQEEAHARCPMDLKNGKTYLLFLDENGKYLKLPQYGAFHKLVGDIENDVYIKDVKSQVIKEKDATNFEDRLANIALQDSFGSGIIYAGGINAKEVTNFTQLPKNVQNKNGEILKKLLGDKISEVEFDHARIFDLNNKKNKAAISGYQWKVPSYISYYRYLFPQRLGLKKVFLQVQLDNELKETEPIQFPPCGQQPTKCEFQNYRVAVEKAIKQGIPKGLFPFRVELKYDSEETQFVWEVTTVTNQNLRGPLDGNEHGETYVMSASQGGFIRKYEHKAVY